MATKRFGASLTRIETQSHKSHARKRLEPSSKSRDLADLSAEQENQFANDLLPRSTRPDEALSNHVATERDVNQDIVHS